MARATLTFRIDEETRQTLDDIAALLDRDRSHVIHEALANYIEIHRWEIDHIREGLRQAEAGEFASESTVRRTLARLRRK